MRTFAFLLIFLVTFNDLFERLFFQPIRQLDDAVLVISSFIIVISAPTILSNQKLRQLCQLVLMLVAINWFSLIDGYPSGISAFFLGNLFFLKPIIFLLFGYVFARKFTTFRYNDLNRCLTLIALFTFSCCLFDIIAPDIWTSIVGRQYVEGSARLMGPFTNAGRNAWILSVIGIWLIFRLVRRKEQAITEMPLSKMMYLAITTYLLGLTYVKKSTFGFAMVGARLVWTTSTRMKKIVVFPVIILLSVPVVVSSLLRLQFEYSDERLERTSRWLLWERGLTTFDNSWFTSLFGVGFGTWGGFASSIIYSPLYAETGLANVYGFYPENPTYVGDNYFAHVFIETGYIGTALWLLVIYRLVNLRKKPQTSANTNWKDQSDLTLNFVYLTLIESFGICAMEISNVSFLTFFTYGAVRGAHDRETSCTPTTYFISP